jgi:hypothetical protein
MTREQGIVLVKQYTPVKPKNLHLFLNWMGITENAFHFIIDQHRNHELWKRNENWEWVLKKNMTPEQLSDLDQARLNLLESWSDFPTTHEGTSTDKKKQYILIGKGY